MHPMSRLSDFHHYSRSVSRRAIISRIFRHPSGANEGSGMAVIHGRSREVCPGQGLRSPFGSGRPRHIATYPVGGAAAVSGPSQCKNGGVRTGFLPQRQPKIQEG